MGPSPGELYIANRGAYQGRMQRRPREPKPAETDATGTASAVQPAPGQTIAPDLASFEAMMLEIERITATLERGDLPLQDSLAAFERASLLTQQAQRLLEQAENRLTRLVESGPGEVTEVPFSLDEPTGGRSQ